MGVANTIHLILTNDKNPWPKLWFSKILGLVSFDFDGPIVEGKAKE
jgi:hypothetical protein